MAQWSEIPWDQKLFENADETILSKTVVALENAYTNPGGGHSRFPGLKPFVDITGTKVYLADWRGDMIAVTEEGRFNRVDKSGNVVDATGTPLGGDGARPVFDKTEYELLAAKGGPIIRLKDNRTDLLSADAPDTTHVAFIDGYVIAIEKLSGRFSHSEAGAYTQWDPLDVFSAEGKPDDLNACIVTPYRELLLSGEDSIEQFERARSGAVPFYRRWTTGEGIMAPYTLIGTRTGNYGVNKLREFVRFSAQVSQPQSDDVSLSLETVDDWTGAWTALVHIKGQKFILLQMPYATNRYGTRGITMLFDYRGKRWSSLYGWDSEQGAPARWPGWSYLAIWGRHFVGGEGKIYELDADTYANDGAEQRMLGRTAHIEAWGRSRVDDLRVRFKRGVDAQDGHARLGVRVNRDNRGFGRWVYKSFGNPGQRDMTLYFGSFGMADTWQFEYAVTDAVSTEIAGMDAYVERLPR